MYQERNDTEIRASRLRIIIVACLVVLLILAGAVGIMSFQESNKEQSAVSIRESILSTAMQCYSIEGSYPSSLNHLKNTYGLTINENDYIVFYEWFADNVPPSVAVEAR